MITNESPAAFIARVSALARREPSQSMQSEPPWRHGRLVTAEIKTRMAEILKAQYLAGAVNLKAIAGEVGVSYDVAAKYTRHLRR